MGCNYILIIQHEKIVLMGYMRLYTPGIISGIKYFGLWFRSNELLLLVGWIVIFGIEVNNQSEVCDEFRTSLGLDDRVSEISLTSSGDLGLLCMCLSKPKRGKSVTS